jgi:hypothetical protein
MEEVFECESITERIGPSPEDDDEDASIPATTAKAQQQTDASDHWVNPSTGYGTGWPRKQEKPDVTETWHAKKIVETVTVSDEYGEASGDVEAGHFESERDIEHSRTVTNTAPSVKNAIYAESDAEVVEAVGLPEKAAGTFVEGTFSVAHMKAAIFVTREEETKANWRFKLDLVAADVTLKVGIRMMFTDMNEVDLIPPLIQPHSYDRDNWVSGSSASAVGNDALSGAGRALGIASFGRGETKINIATPSFGIMIGGRMSAHLCVMATEIFFDHIEASLEGSRTQIGLAHLAVNLVKSGLHAVHSESGAVNLEAAAMSVRS